MGGGILVASQVHVPFWPPGPCVRHSAASAKPFECTQLARDVPTCHHHTAHMRRATLDYSLIHFGLPKKRPLPSFCFPRLSWSPTGKDLASNYVWDGVSPVRYVQYQRGTGDGGAGAAGVRKKEFTGRPRRHARAPTRPTPGTSLEFSAEHVRPQKGPHSAYSRKTSLRVEQGRDPGETLGWG